MSSEEIINARCEIKYTVFYTLDWVCYEESTTKRGNCHENSEYHNNDRPHDPLLFQVL